MDAITEEGGEVREEDDNMEEDEEQAVEDALREAEFMENVEAATENTWLEIGWKEVLDLVFLPAWLVCLSVCLST